MKFKNALKSTVALTALFAVAVPATADAGNVTNGKSKNSLAVSGQVVKTISRLSDGVSEKTVFTDGDWTKSRVRWVASGKLSADVSAGATIEMDIPISQEAGNQKLGTLQADGANNSTATDTTAWTIRHQYMYANSKTYGKVYLGQTSGAADGSGEASFGGTGIFSGSDGSSYGSGVFFMETSTASAPTTSTVKVSSVATNLDHNGRIDVLRYDMPKFAGIGLKGSVQGSGDWEVGATYNEKIDGITVRARAGYSDFNSTQETKSYRLTGSVAAKYNGFDISFAAGKEGYHNAGGAFISTGDPVGDVADDGTQTPHFWALGVGYTTKLIDAGSLGVTYHYGDYNNTVVNKAGHENNEGKSHAVAAMQTFDAIGAKIGVEYVTYSYDSHTNLAANTFDDIDAVSLMTVFAF